MYESHYGFNAKPFSIVPNPNIIFLNENYQNALSYMKYGLKEKVGFILLTGEIGAGKTTLIRYMLGAIEDRMDFAVIFNTHFSADQLFRLILSEFEISSDSMEKERHLELLYEFLIDRYAEGRHVLLIIDEAQNLSDNALEDIRMLSNLQTNEQILLQIMLVGQPELKKRLASPHFRQLAQRIAVSYHLPPLTEDQTYRYVAYRIEAVGGQADIFTPEAVRLIHDNSGGIPRTINLLCDAALVYGFADDLQRIDRDTVELVLADQICILDPSCPANHAEPPTQLTSPGATDDLRSRMALVERTVSNLQWRLEDLSREVKNELLFKYQELLISERNKYDHLKKEHDQLLHEHTRVLDKLDSITQPAVKKPKIDPDQKVKRPTTNRTKIWWGKHHGGRSNYANDENFTSNPAGIKPMFGQRIVNFDPASGRSLLWAKIMDRCSSFSASVRKKYEQFSMPHIRLPSLKRWVDGINPQKRITLHWLSWSVVCLILISFISLFLITRQPTTATVSSMKQFENREDAERGPTADKEKENVATVIAEKEFDSEPQKPLEITFDTNSKKQIALRYIVQAGDTLTSIARAYKTNVDAIISENNLQNHLIYIGQTLTIPFSGMEGRDPNAG
jgi:general secretion pathway protein A